MSAPLTPVPPRPARRLGTAVDESRATSVAGPRSGGDVRGGDAPAPRRGRRLRSGGRRRLALGGAVLAAGAAGYVLLLSGVCDVAEVDVLGAGRVVPVATVAAAAEGAVGAPLALVSASGIAERVERIPGVGSVEVQRSWPSRLTLVVVERTPVAVLTLPSGAVYIDGEARVLPMAGTAVDRRGLPTVAAAGVAEPAVGSTVDDTSVTALAAVLGGLPADVLAKVGSAEAPTPNDVTLRMRTGGVVRWGSADDTPRKLAAYQALLAALAPTVPGLIDVSAPESPAVAPNAPRPRVTAPRPSASASPSPSPSPSATPALGETAPPVLTPPRATPTPKPSLVKPAATPKPSATPKATGAPRPTPKPTGAPRPTPKPTAATTPGATARPSTSPRP